MVLSDKEGLGRRGSVRDFAGRSVWTSSTLPTTDVSTACELVADCCIDWLVPLFISTVDIVLVAFFAACPGKIRLLIAYSLGGPDRGDTFTAVRGRGSRESLGIPDA